MRIALVSMHTSPAQVPGSGDSGGMNVVVSEAARALAGRGHDVTVVTRVTAATPPGERRLFGSTRAAGRGSETHPRLVALEAGAPELPKDELEAVVPEFGSRLRELGEFDAVHSHYWLSGLASQRAFGNSDAVLAHTLHTVGAQKNQHLAPGDVAEPASRLQGERRLAQTGVLVAGSHSELAAIREHYGEPGPGATVIHPGVDTDLFRPRTPPTAALRITVLGRVQPLKGQDLAVRAAAALAAADPELFARTDWVVAGEPTPGAEPYAAGLRELARERGIADRVRFLPAQTRHEAAELLASSAVVVVPSHSETFGLTALEAAASGVPVVAGAHTGLLEAVPARVAGAQLVGRDPSDWARAIGALLHDEAGRARVGAAARAHAVRHNWEAHAIALERLYEAARHPLTGGRS